MLLKLIKSILIKIHAFIIIASTDVQLVAFGYL